MMLVILTKDNDSVVTIPDPLSVWPSGFLSYAYSKISLVVY